MAKRVLTVYEQVRKLNVEQQRIVNKFRRLAPAGTIECTPTEDGKLLTWQIAWKSVVHAAECLEDLAQDLIIYDLEEEEERAAANGLTTNGI